MILAAHTCRHVQSVDLPCRHVYHNVFFFNDPATTEIYTLSLHDALPICWRTMGPSPPASSSFSRWPMGLSCLDRKSTRLNSSHTVISYAVFCLKKKKNNVEVSPSSNASPLTMTR